jgi:hypothetical protein
MNGVSSNRSLCHQSGDMRHLTSILSAFCISLQASLGTGLLKHRVMRPIFLLAFFFVFFLAEGQERNQFISVAFTSSNSAYPFAKFSGLIERVHPGIGIGWQINWKEKNKRYWYQQVEAGYFFHRFVQHGISLYSNFGYGYKFSRKWKASASLGAGYFHSIATTAVLKADKYGDYESAKGVGRPQAMFAFTIGSSYQLGKDKLLFVNYQQRLQTPFIKSYVPILPYNMIMIGMQKQIK